MVKPKNKEEFQGEEFVKSFISTILWCLVFPCVLWSGLDFFWGEYAGVTWHEQEYYLQQKKIFLGEREHNLFYKIDEKKELILPQVYGYLKEGDVVYFAAVSGYGVVNLKDGSAEIFLQSKQIEQIKSTFINYHDDLSFFDEEIQEKLVTLPHELIAYFWDKDRGETVGDGRFQCMYLYDMDDNGSYSLEAYGPYVNSWHDTLLPHLNGYCIEKKSQIMYLTSRQGYAIIDGLSGTCRIYFTDPELAEKDYQKDIYVLDSFEDFTPEEQEILRKVEQKGL